MGKMESIIPLMAALKIHEGHYRSFSDYSVTQLIDTPRRVALHKRYGDRIVYPPESQAASFVGTGVHHYWEHCLKQYAATDPKFVVERTMSCAFDDRLVSGRFDVLYDNRIMYDVKTCKVWKMIFDPDMTEWTQQQNLYAFLLHKRSVDIESARIIAQFMDWVQSQSLRDKDYPKAAVEEYEIELWGHDEQEYFLRERLAAHKLCENVPDDQLPLCSPEERWERHPGGATVKYAILKSRDADRAINKGVFDTLDEAIKRIRDGGTGITSSVVIEVRYAQRKRCEQWCGVSGFCNDYLNYLQKVEAGILNDYITYDQVMKGDIFV